MVSKEDNNDFLKMTNEELVIFFNNEKIKVNKLCQEISDKILEYEPVRDNFLELLKEIEKREIKVEL